MTQADKALRDEAREAMTGMDRRVLFWALLELTDEAPELVARALATAQAQYAGHGTEAGE